MYGLPRDVSLDFFPGKTLIQVCFGPHDLIFNFDGDVSVSVMSSVGYEGADGQRYHHDDYRQIAPIVLGLLNQSVTSATGDEAGTLTLKYSGGGTLHVYDDSSEYESYTIRNGEQMIIV